ncbi:MAG: hypothetical protein PWQ79_846 [Thermococcaceae archaeon]|nr:hypothetical protein [Thermococcaceae archaeon]MDK2913931.1 hypothetical protein [Thermococcaceae archaeon]
MQPRFFLSTSLLALSLYFAYLILIFALTHLGLSGDEPSTIIDFLPLALGILVVSIPSFFFLKMTRMSPGLFWMFSTVTVTFASLLTYPIATRGCTPATCDDTILWFFLVVLTSLGFLIGAAIYRLSGWQGFRNSQSS